MTTGAASHVSSGDQAQNLVLVSGCPGANESCTTVGSLRGCLAAVLRIRNLSVASPCLYSASFEAGCQGFLRKFSTSEYGPQTLLKPRKIN